MSNTPVLQVRNLSRSYDDFTLSGISFELEEGQVAAMLGPSGAGKTTLLRLIAGLDTPDQGEILWEGQSLSQLPPHQRHFGLMVQDYALFPHMTVAENVGFGVRMAGADSKEVEARTGSMLKLVGLGRFGDRGVETLSGGEKQRVALARSLAPQPRLLMLDEPLGSLDRSLRDRLLIEMPDMLAEVDQTAIYVTHDQDEAFAVAQTIILLEAGRIAQLGTPEKLYREPESTFVARFLGLDNILTPKPVRQNGTQMLETPLGSLQAPQGAANADILIRPDALRPGSQGPAVIEAIVLSRSFRGGFFHVTVDIQNTELNLVLLSSENVPSPGQPITLSYDPETALQLLP